MASSPDNGDGKKTRRPRAATKPHATSLEAGSGAAQVEALKAWAEKGQILASADAAQLSQDTDEGTGNEVPAADGNPSKFPDTGPPPFDPEPVIARLNCYWVNGKDLYLRMPVAGDDQVEKWSDRILKRELRLEGVCSRNGEARTFSQADVVMRAIHRKRRVEFAGEIAGMKVGIHLIEGKRVAVTSSYRLIEPVAGPWPLLRAVLESRLQTPDVDQLPYFFAWLKVAVTSLRATEARPGQLLVLVGASDSGKSFIQEHLLTPLLGGRSADPTPLLLGKTIHTGDVVGSEHLMIQELPSGLDGESRAMLGEELKRLVVNESLRLRLMHQDGIMVRPWRRVTLSMNDNIERLKTLPALTSDFADKVLLLRCESKPMPMATRTEDERIAFRQTIEAELPAFVAWLLDWEIPNEIQASEHAGRFGCDSWQHPDIAAMLFEQEPESLVLWAVNNTPGLYERSDTGRVEAIGWHVAEELRTILLAGPCSGRLEKMLQRANSLPFYLAKLAKKFPDRFLKRHTKEANVWLIHPSDSLPANLL